MRHKLFSGKSLIAVICMSVLFISCSKIITNFLTPRHDFSESKISPEPDYSQYDFWAALPQKKDFSDFRPEGIAEADSALKSVDVFFIHPTGYFRREYWNDPIDLQSGTSKNTDRMMLNHASIFNDCRVYAPRYRQATIITFTNMKGGNEKQALALAYQDVKAAFQYFLNHFNNNRPFILAGHSQGSYHGKRLIEELIDGNVLSEKMIAAYLIGTTEITNEWANTLKSIEVCDDPTQQNCLINFNTHAEGIKPSIEWGKSHVVCVNPLNWKKDGGHTDQSSHLGFVEESGRTQIDLWGADKADAESLGPLSSPIPNHTHAACENGVVLIENQNLAREILVGDYHAIELSLFHMNIRKNVAERSQAYLMRNSKNE